MLRKKWQREIKHRPTSIIIKMHNTYWSGDGNNEIISQLSTGNWKFITGICIILYLGLSLNTNSWFYIIRQSSSLKYTQFAFFVTIYELLNVPTFKVLWYWDNHIILRIWVNGSLYKSVQDDNITTTLKNKTNHCAYFIWYTMQTNAVQLRMIGFV